MLKARELLNQPPVNRSLIPSSSSIFKPGYDIKGGDKILFVVLSEYDSMVIEAMCLAEDHLDHARENFLRGQQPGPNESSVQSTVPENTQSGKPASD